MNRKKTVNNTIGGVELIPEKCGIDISEPENILDKYSIACSTLLARKKIQENMTIIKVAMVSIKIRILLLLLRLRLFNNLFLGFNVIL
jgi:hypothetical protein